jgi:16S rRNA (uracil1498-N3)-methyltransferase
VTEGYASAAPAAAHVFVEAFEVLDGDDDIWIDGDDGHHLQRVRRLRVGEAVTASDGRGAWRLCTIAEVGERRLRLAASGPLTHEPELVPRVVVAFAPAKGDQAGAVVHQLVELGVDAVMPITLHRSVVRWDGERGGRARDRLTRVIRESAMQSRRSRLPDIRDEASLEEIARHPGLLVAGPGGLPAHRLAVPDGGEWLVVVGPEGGLDQVELEVLRAGTDLGIGPYVLRSVTAPVAAAAALVGLRTAVSSP